MPTNENTPPTSNIRQWAIEQAVALFSGRAISSPTEVESAAERFLRFVSRRQPTNGRLSRRNSP